MRRAALVCLAGVVAGCAVSNPGLGYVGGWDWNISDEPERWAGFEANRIYRLQRDVFVTNVEDRTNGLALVPDMDADVPRGTVRGPTTIAGYQGDARPWPQIQGVVESGTRLRATRLRAKGNIRASKATMVYVKAQMLDGEFQGQVLDLQALSLYAVDPETGQENLVGPNEDYLVRSN